VDLKRLGFNDLPAHGIEIDERLGAMYSQAASLWTDRPIIFDVTFSDPHSNGGMRVYQHSVTVWLKPNASGIRDTVAHELAHVINDRLKEMPRLDPDRPGPPHRQILSDLIFMPDHQQVHRLMQDYGFDTAAEARSKSLGFLLNVRRAPLDRLGANRHLSIGYALMLTIYRTEDLVDQTMAAMRKKGRAVSFLGEQLAAYVGAERTTSLYEDALRLMELARIEKALSECVLSKEQFRARYGWV
jgi:hypothetical protein